MKGVIYFCLLRFSRVFCVISFPWVGGQGKFSGMVRYTNLSKDALGLAVVIVLARCCPVFHAPLVLGAVGYGAALLCGRWCSPVQACTYTGLLPWCMVAERTHAID